MNIDYENINGNLYEMERLINNILLSIILFFLFYGCSSNRQIGVQNAKEMQEKKIDLIQDSIIQFSTFQDSIFKFECQGRSFDVKGKNINRPYFPVHLRNCLLHEGFNGNKSANKQLAFIITGIEHYKLLLFGQDPKFRGPEVFEAFLSKANDHTPLFDPDVEDFRYITGTIGSGYRGLCQSMIKSIDGKSQSQWRIDLFYDYEIKNLEWDMETGLFNPAYGKEVGEKYYNALLKAWQEGKISLKNYGEE